MNASDLVLDRCVSVGPFAPVHRLEDDMARDRFVVIEDDGVFLGLVTTADVLRRPRRLIIDCLTDKPHIAADQSLLEVLAVMESSCQPFLPVFDGVDFAGVVSYRSVVAQLTLERAALRAQRVMAGGLAHDINNALMSVVGEIEIARGSDGPTDRDDALTRASEAVAQVALLAQELRAFGLGVDADAEIVAFHELVEQWATLASRSEFGDLDLRMEGSHFTVRGVRLQLAQLVYNLVLNAAQAAGESGVVRVLLSTVMVAGDRFAELVVADDGPGIANDVRHRVFEPYFTTREEGTGLGLAIVRTVVEAHAGAITIETPTAGGTRVTVRLPLAAS